jgi:hypothetical protein
MNFPCPFELLAVGLGFCSIHKEETLKKKLTSTIKNDILIHVADAKMF